MRTEEAGYKQTIMKIIPGSDTVRPSMIKAAQEVVMVTLVVQEIRETAKTTVEVWRDIGRKTVMAIREVMTEIAVARSTDQIAATV